MTKAEYVEEIREQLAERFGCSPDELDGANIYAELRDAESNGTTVCWGIVESRIQPADTFPAS